MPFTSTLYNLLTTHYYFFTWRDALEILFFATLFYYISCWLKKDMQKNLLPYFYSYCLITFSAYMLELTTATYFLFLFWPACVLLLMFMHQETLQRNIIAIKNIHPSVTQSQDWVETLMRVALININNNKPLYCIIEHTDSMKEFLHTMLPITADINQGLLKLLVESTACNQEKMIWLRTNGQLTGINTTWKQYDFEQESDPIAWQHETLLYTAKTDALAFYADPVSRSFTIIVSNKIVNNVSSYHALSIIKKQYNIQSKSENTTLINPTHKIGKKHEINTQKNTNQQRPS